jgi:hypothetical protein
MWATFAILSRTIGAKRHYYSNRRAVRVRRDDCMVALLLRIALDRGVFPLWYVPRYLCLPQTTTAESLDSAVRLQGSGFSCSLTVPSAG